MGMAMSLDKKIFYETEGAILRGEYSRNEGQRKFLGTRLDMEEVTYFSAEDVDDLVDGADERLVDRLGDACEISVRELDTLEAALIIQAERADADDADALPVLALNFACAFQPAGNLLIGKNTQEGELCRRSTVHASISDDEAREFYEANCDLGGSLYTNGVLVSPYVEVFRETDYLTMETPVVVAVISSPAPYVMGLADMPEDELFANLKARIQGFLAVAASEGYKHLVLGAWGCGSNGNDPALVARAFHEALDTPLAGSTFANLFNTVTFAIIESGGTSNIEPFKKEFE